MIRIGICEDNEWEKLSLRNEIELCLCNRNVCHEIYDYPGATEFLEEGRAFDLVFLDIDMPGMNGIHLGKKIREANKKVKIIYVTGHAEYTYAAYDVHAFSYLLKPLDGVALRQKIVEMLEYLSDQSGPMMALKTMDGTLLIEPERVYYFEFVDRKIKVVTDQQEYIMKGALSQLAESIRLFGFEMPHQSFIVNMYHIRQIISYKIYLVNKAELPLAEKKSASFKAIYNDFLQEIADRIL